MKFDETEYLFHQVMFEMCLALCKFPMSFSTKKLKLGHNVSQSIKRFNLGLWNLGLRLYFQVFSNPRRDRKLGFFNVPLAELLNFPQFMEEIENWWISEYQLRLYVQIFRSYFNSWKIGIFKVLLLLYFIRLWGLSFR